MKKFSIIVVYALVIAAILLIVLPKAWFPSFYDVRYTGWSELAAAAIIYFLPFLFRVSAQEPDAERKNRGVDIFQFAAAVAVFADFLGALGLYLLYQIGIPYSYILHFSTPLFATIMFSLFMEKRYSMRPVRAIIYGFLLTLLFCCLWEVLENSADHFLGTHLAGPDQTNSTNVTVLDLYLDTAGAALGAAIMFFRSRTKN